MEFHPCGICGVHVLETDEAVQCDGQCSLWHHRECLGMTLAEYLKLSRGQEDWFCRKCIVKQEIKQEARAERRRQQRSEMGKTKIECKKLDVLTGDQKCVFCHQTDVDEMKYGPLYMHKNIITHYYCLLLSSNMEQNGKDCDGILGFLPNDIHKEVRRGARLYCTYCRSGGATLGCAIAKCKVVFHLPCGMKHWTLHQFFGEFKSFCAKHRPVQKISEKILAESSKNAMCGICYEKVVPRPIHETLWAPCCQKSAFFHRDCVQKLATSAGYFFKCPLCNNTSMFQKEMKEFGIYIPEQDASWECVPNAYQDLLVRHDTCDSASCSCPSGRKTNNQGTRWELILCKFCGSQGIHIGCGRLKWKSPEFVCDICSGNNEREEEANRRNCQGNRHRLSGTGRTAEIHPSVSADREGERSDDDSSDESAKVTLTNRGGRRRVISPPPKIETPSPDTRTHKKSERHGKRSAPTSTIKAEVARPKDTVTVVIEDSDDEVEVVSETKGGSCLKTIDGSTIPIIKLGDSAKKRPNAVGDVKVVEEIVDITIHREGPPSKRNPSPHVEEVIYSLPSPMPKPSTSTPYCPPSTSFTAPPLDTTKFVLVDSSTFRPEDLPPGTLLYRSFTPMMPVPQTGAPPQPQVQPIPTSQVPMPQLGGPSGRSADAKHPDLSKHGRRGSVHLNAPARHTKKTSRSNEYNSSGRRGGRRRDHDRLNPRVLLSPLKFRISNDGFFEILLPRRNLGFGFGSSSLKRKASPLPSRPAKKIKVSSKDSVVKEKKKNLKKSSSSKQEKPNQSKKRSSKSSTERKKEYKKSKVSQNNEIVQRDTEKKLESDYSNQITKFFSSKKSDQKKKKKISVSKSKVRKGKENTSPEKKQIVKNKQEEEKGFSTQWKCKKIDEYLSKSSSKPIMQSIDLHKKIQLSKEEGERYITVKEIMDQIIGFVVEKHLLKEPSTTGNGNTSSLDISNEIDVSVQSSNSPVTETVEQRPDSSGITNCGSSLDIFNETNSCLENNSSTLSDSSEKDLICEASLNDFNNFINELPALDISTDITNEMKKVNETNNLSLKTKTASPMLVSSQIEISDRVISCETSNEKHNSLVSLLFVDAKGRFQEIVKHDSESDSENSEGSQTTEIPSELKEGSLDTGVNHSFSMEGVKQVNFEENELQITSNPYVKTCSVKACGLFPKIKIKTSKEPKRNKAFQSLLTKKTKIKNVCWKVKGISSTELMEKSKTKRNVKDIHPPKPKRRKIEVNPIHRVGTIEKYFSPLKRDYSFSALKKIGNMTCESNENTRKEKKNDYVPPPLAKLENSRFWKTFTAQNSPEKIKETTVSPSPNAKLGNSILLSYLNASPEKRPLTELKFNESVTTNVVKEIQFKEF